MPTRPKHILSQLVLAMLLATFGLIASAPAVQAQCASDNCLTSETAAVEFLPAPPAPPALLAVLPAAGDRLVCDNFPNCLLAEATPALAAGDTAAPRTKAPCETYPNCLVVPGTLPDEEETG
jgi:hypothetical protein